MPLITIVSVAPIARREHLETDFFNGIGQVERFPPFWLKARYVIEQKTVAGDGGNE